MSRRLGQHFLKDPRILDRIVAAISPQPSDIVVEIGPGEGTLTARLSSCVGSVVAIEKDVTLARNLSARPDLSNVRVIEGDALKTDWQEMATEAADMFKVIGNVPYYISTPLIHQALSYRNAVVIVFLLQSEVGERICAAPGAKTYGGLSVGVQSFATAERLFRVPAGAFKPRPTVDSVVVRLTPRVAPLVGFDRRDAFRVFVTSLFGQRRKRMVRCLRNAQHLDAAAAEAALEAAGADPDARPETLSPEVLADLFNVVLR